jgi:ParB family transcriptional regulator, chromosome partitioning protein
MRSPLGKGLSALLTESAEEYGELQADDIRSIAIDVIHADPAQPRQYFEPEALQELADSIKTKGILQPILVRRQGEGHYQLVAGERRLRAAQLAGLSVIPSIIKTLTDAEAYEIALLENIQRQDLTPLEEARGYRELQQKYDHTQESLAAVIHKSRSHIANTLRLLQLPITVQQQVEKNRLSAGHAKLLVGNAQAEELAAQIIQNKWSVRQLEQFLQQESIRKTRTQNTPHKLRRVPEILHFEEELKERLGVVVRITERGGKGWLSLHYSSNSELEGLVALLMGTESGA